MSLLLFWLFWPAIAEYRAALADVRGGGGSVEKAYHSALAAGEALSPVVEELSETELADVQREAEGLIVNTQEVILTQPLPSFFLDLAKKYGNEPDVAFFTTLVATYPDEIWPVYLVQETDVTGCLQREELAPAKARWLEFRAKYPNAYQADVERELKAIENAATTRECDPD